MGRSLHQLHMMAQCCSGIPLPGPGNRHSRAIAISQLHMMPQCGSGIPLPGLGNRHSSSVGHGSG
ncbi:hypothetical protein Egran_03525 [Elaphomyces granulatus]|uniref:Uncharacterized protein n=1 Tax=Elaphomyces granulatus TaxID=519963 RepID=A0A232LX63_9EURO|nr:hypothetical protein Egran_03525 [Elaphomyces granulatus]